jgi:hypothetical protein
MSKRNEVVKKDQKRKERILEYTYVVVLIYILELNPIRTKTKTWFYLQMKLFNKILVLS